MPDYTKKFGDREYGFGRPNTDKIDRYLRGARKNLTKASVQLASDTIVPEHRDAWNQAVAAKPGLAVQAVSMMLEDLGYAGDDDEGD